MNQAFRTTGRIVVVNENNEFLLVKIGKVRAMPGGGIDFGESLHDVIARESFEELGVQALFSKIIFIQDYKGERKGVDTHFIEFFCTVKNNDNFSEVIERTKEASHGDELSDIGRFSLDNFPKDFLPTALVQVLREYLLRRELFEVRYESDLG